MHGKKVRAVALPTSTGKINIGNVAGASTVITYLGAVVEMAAGSVIITDSAGGFVDQVAATTTAVGRSWYGPEGLTVNGPLTVTVTGTVAGAAYLG